MIPSPDQVGKERARGNCTSRGPGFTFHCAKCQQRKGLTGSKNIGRKRYCADCVALELNPN
jgi:hypothetical protein